ncbi:hypothetical protein SAMN04488540_10174 [Ferrimonas sediminum]|uniref:Chemotaxis methyl-accepting receptor HlyB-like 4HB MCP domain-containing protein n=1 Tax=Ferrimonas sediminum TaxID=718193 RepID=A0A1G8JJZ9_9GAMM|nr:hypothetical protein [Ferrimonas sediminum]SDI31411.1 hypothetical protein SAMN04488540_10174 [Ferrimonas sediminum]
MKIDSKAQASAKVGKRRPKLDNQDLVKTSFWISQVFMLIATVVGVYLAAQQGLSQAIAFDALTSKQNNYYLRHALYDEVNDNVAIINAYADTVLTESHSNLKTIHPQMAQFVWNNMRYSSQTLETPSQILTETRRFYMAAADIIQKMESRTYGSHYGANKLKELTAGISSRTLPALQHNYQTLATELKAADIIVE